jgi:putative hemolysin
MTGYVFLLGFLLLLSGFFSGTETAFTSLSLMDIEEIRKNYPRRGDLIRTMNQRPDTLLAAVLIGNNLVNIGISVLSTELTIRFFGSTALGITTGILTLMILVFGEIVPKQLAILYNKNIVLVTCQLIFGLIILFTPLIWILGALSRLIHHLSGGKGRNQLTLDGILHMVKHAETIGLLENYRSRMVKSIFRFNDVTVHAVMTHRTKVFSLPHNLELTEALGTISKAGFSRIPVYGKDPETIVGVVLEKDVIQAVYQDDSVNQIPAKPKYLKDIMLPPVVVPESWRIHRVFGKLKTERLNLAIVLDEYGGLAGIVTMEDLVEEIIGELYDENEEKSQKQITKVGSGQYLIQGDTPIHLLEDILDREIPHDRTVETVGGYISSLSESFPHEGDEIHTDFGVFQVVKLSKKQILRVSFEPHL